ncbi:3-hydroxyacyl-CoA dehydrogenase family protein [Mameliella alba]|uniref:3-hydroxyacyl-CoA dehydrogenase family protein n=1 Tax=Mameliella alba TaxID=561184 RepID=UPI001FAFAF79|nr:3-hydroxyacyl-CoA dehydrogenase family protein [Mameliella alba]
MTQAKAKATAFFDRSLAKGKLTPEARDAAVTNILTTTRLDDLAGTDLVIEAIFEDMEAKAALIGELDRVCGPETILASNTSPLSITRIGAHSTRPERVVGLHFCLPAQLMKLVEVTRGLRTDDAVFDRAWAYCTAIGQKPVETKDTPGFILNHFAIPLHNRAIRMVESGVATPADIDRAIKTAYGHAMGPLEWLDLVGLDTQQRLCRTFHEITNDPELVCPNLVHVMVAAGWLGKKTGSGFYDYADTKTFGA